MYKEQLLLVPSYLDQLIIKAYLLLIHPCCCCTNFRIDKKHVNIHISDQSRNISQTHCWKTFCSTDVSRTSPKNCRIGIWKITAYIFFSLLQLQYVRAADVQQTWQSWCKLTLTSVKFNLLIQTYHSRDGDVTCKLGETERWPNGCGFTTMKSMKSQ